MDLFVLLIIQSYPLCYFLALILDKKGLDPDQVAVFSCA